MRLKRIDIKGFKSFAKETHILFDENIIGIVGPNGSGKSNIVDAIRWVLGEQSSRELRLESMGDVLFNGSKAQKASNAAVVSITFENTKNLLPTEFNELTLTRKLLRNGDSEYRINDVKCRLKDIHNLFMDSGIGSNSYAIIALGMVDDILADKENARRAMFEQAAGISKYKSRKKETLRKLKNTEDDLNRIEDLVFEIEKNLKSLERQAKRTKRYFEMKKDFQNLSIDLALIRSQKIKDKLQQLQEKLVSEKSVFQSLEVEITQLDSDIEVKKKDSLEHEIALSDAQKQINRSVAIIRSTEEEIRILKQQQNFRQQELSDLSQSLTDYNRQLAEIASKQDRLTDRWQEENQKHQQYKEDKTILEKEMLEIKQQYEQGKKQVDLLYHDIRQQEKLVLTLEKDIQVLQSKEKNDDQSIDQVDQRIQQRKVQFKKDQEWLDQVDRELATLTTEIQGVEGELEALLNEKSRIEQERKEIQHQIQQYHRSLDAKSNELNLLKDFVNKMEGYSDSIKFLSRSNPWSKEPQLLSDVLTADPKYRGVLETFLGDYLNYFIVDTPADALSAIDLLQQKNKGRCSFFVLEEWASMSIPRPLPMEGGIPVIDILEFNPMYTSLFANLFNRVYIVEQTERLEKVAGDDHTYLYLDGHIQYGPGWMSGGSVGLFGGNKLGRKIQIDELKTAIQNLNGQITQLNKNSETLQKKLTELNEGPIKQKLAKLQQQYSGLMAQKVKVDTTVEMSHKEIEKLSEELDSLKARRSQSFESLKELQQRLGVENTKLRDQQSTLSSKDETYRGLSDRYNEVRQNYNEANIREIQQQNLVQQLQKEVDFLKDKDRDLQQSIVKATDKKANTTNIIESLTEKLSHQEKQLLDYVSNRKSDELTLNDVEKAYYAVRMEVSALESEVKKKHQQQRNAQVVINEINEKVNVEKFELAKIWDRLKIEFEIEESQLTDDRTQTELSESELEDRVQKMRQRLSNFGEINPLAVEAYEEISERHSEIITQRDDVLAARDQLVETMDEIENTATQKFLASFESVRENFIQVFRRLFTEDDDCDLILLDPENPLESKIEIIAKPKGKRPKSISQLSGGEKTLTATALLFALYLLKPAPFCIFDEVDAPLDDANIYKFNKIIQEFSSDSQFIIVTHNKLTMEAVDIIYGVFMENTGVSNVAAVDFRHLDTMAELAIN